ncbi:MAG: transporter substrate-binding domain-containing protein [Bacteroidia bacterium]|nr:transporter substrate-binding domain-containing protein [Bacteroidia bacterium]
MKCKIVLCRKTLFLVLFAALLTLPVILTQCKKDKSTANGDPEKFTYLTEDYPPFNYSENGQVNGVSVDILEGLFKKLGLSIDRSVINVSAWASAYETVLTMPNTMLFSMVRTSERDSLFKWVGPIAPHTEIVLSLKDSGIQLKEITDLNNYFTGVVDGYSSIDMLMDSGVLRANIIVYNNLAEMYKALVDSREVQCISTSQAGHSLIIQALGYSANDFGAPFTVHSDQLYYAFNIETSDAMITGFQDQLDKLKSEKAADGSSEYEKIISRYSLIQHATDGITDEQVINLVNRTAADIASDAHGTISKINQGLVPYKDQNNNALYVFAYDKNVVIIAHATNQSIVGISFAGKPDVAGKKFRDEIVQGALINGTGWVDYIYTMTDQSGLYYKTTYYKLVMGSNSVQYVVCAGKSK